VTGAERKLRLQSACVRLGHVLHDLSAASGDLHALGEPRPSEFYAINQAWRNVERIYDDLADLIALGAKAAGDER